MQRIFINCVRAKAVTLRIEDYALMALQKADLVGATVPIDWLCWPCFDSCMFRRSWTPVVKAGEAAEIESAWPDCLGRISARFSMSGSSEMRRSPGNTT